MKRLDDLNENFISSPLTPGTFKPQDDAQTKTQKHFFSLFVPIVGVLLVGVVVSSSFLFIRQLHPSSTPTSYAVQSMT